MEGRTGLIFSLGSTARTPCLVKVGKQRQEIEVAVAGRVGGKIVVDEAVARSGR